MKRFLIAVAVLCAVSSLSLAIPPDAPYDIDIGVVTEEHPQDISQPGGDYGNPVWDPFLCYTIEIKAMAAPPGTAIVVTLRNNDPNIPDMVIELEYGEDPVIVECTWFEAVIDLHPDSDPGLHAAWGVKWTPPSP